MAQYQNLFTTVQATGPLHMGVPLGHGNSPRTGQPWINYWAGRDVEYGKCSGLWNLQS